MFNSLFNDVIDQIYDWSPKKFNNENQYRDNLLAFLRERLNQASFFSYGKILITPEHGRGLCDVCVGGKIGIELKKDLNNKAKVDRLLGQIQRYRKEYEDLVIVLVGRTNLNSLDDLKYHIAGFSESILILDRKPVIIDKGFSKKPKSPKLPKSDLEFDDEKDVNPYDIQIPEIKFPSFKFS